MVPRFHVPHIAPRATDVTLDATQSHHLARVLRLRPGDPVRVFDGRGAEWEGHVGAADPRRATILALRAIEPLRAWAVAADVLAAVVRGPAMDALVHDATMMGAARIVPVLSARASVTRQRDATVAAVERWRRIAVSTCRQCGRATVPDVAEAAPLADALAAVDSRVRLLLVEPTLDRPGLRRVDHLGPDARAGGATLAIGPEGGWTPAEVDQAEAAGFTSWSLGTIVLRAESVPLAALSVLRYAWE